MAHIIRIIGWVVIVAAALAFMAFAYAVRLNHHAEWRCDRGSTIHHCVQK